MSENREKYEVKPAPGPTNPARVKGFVKYFNSYIATIFVAAIPAPLSQWQLMPIIDRQRGLLSIATPIFCFLTLAFIFSFRDQLAGPMFPFKAKRGKLISVLGLGPKSSYMFSAFWEKLCRLVPVALIGGSLLFASRYYKFYLPLSDMGMYNDLANSHNAGVTNILSFGGYNELLPKLPLYYILSFVLAEAAFVWMALKEYLQDVLEISDLDLIMQSESWHSVSVSVATGHSQPSANDAQNNSVGTTDCSDDRRQAVQKS